MKTITVYDPPMCCSSGVCGPEVDPVLTRVAGMLAQIEGAGVAVERYNLAQQPMAFAKNTEVRAVLDKEGTEALPLFFVDEECLFKGRYPEAEERAQLVKQARGETV